MTDKQLYQYFLLLVNKEATHTIMPWKFNLVANVAAINWAKNLLPEKEFVQSRIDDLDFLYIIFNEPIVSDQGTENIFTKPENYMHGNRAEFVVQYLNSPCYDDGLSGRKTATLLKSDRVSAIKDSYYNRPKDSRLYFRSSQGKIQLLTGKDSGLSESVGKQLFLEYYKYPDLINFEEGSEKELEFGRKQAIEIAEKAAQEFLERNRDPRYESYLQEQIIKNRI